MDGKGPPRVDPRGNDVDTVRDGLAHAICLLSRQRLYVGTDLSLTASHVLYRLQSGGPVRLTTLASSAEISQPSMTQLIQRLERRELVARLADPGDRRAALVTITDAGHRLVVERQEHVRERVGELMAMPPIAQREALYLAADVALPIILNLIELESAQQ
jgi:DNA-binding MarR family transcriptional regulator